VFQGLVLLLSVKRGGLSFRWGKAEGFTSTGEARHNEDTIGTLDLNYKNWGKKELREGGGTRVLQSRPY